MRARDGQLRRDQRAGARDVATLEQFLPDIQGYATGYWLWITSALVMVLATGVESVFNLRKPRMDNPDKRQQQQSEDSSSTNVESQTALRGIRHIAC